MAPIRRSIGQLVFSAPSTRFEIIMLMMPPLVDAGILRTFKSTRLTPLNTEWIRNKAGAVNTNRKSIGSVMADNTAVIISGRMSDFVASLFFLNAVVMNAKPMPMLIPIPTPIPTPMPMQILMPM